MSAAVQVGGAVRPGGLYVRRPADAQLVEALTRGELCVVLAPRQIGKSSLRAHAGRALAAAGLRVATVDLSGLGVAGLDPATWWFGLACELLDGLGVREPAALWAAGEGMPPATRLLRALEQAVVRAPGPPAAVFLDELDTLRALPFGGDDLLGAVRAAWDRRAADPAWARLRFCLMGVAAPADLMQDPRRTPFNVGREIRLEDFTPPEAAALLPALEGLGAPAQALLDEVLGWTAGHPYQCAQLIAALGEEGPSATPPASRVAQTVERLYRGAWSDPSLEAGARVLVEAGDGALLALYRRTLAPPHVAWDRRDPLHMQLRLSGLAAARGPVLCVRNRVIAGLYDEAWVARAQGRRALREAAWVWARAGRPEEGLPTEAQLAALRPPPGVELEREELELILRAEGRARAQRAERRARWLRGLAGGLTLLGLGLALWGQQSRRESAWRAQLQAQADLPAVALVPGRQEEALDAALTAWAVLQDSPFAALSARYLAETLDALRGPQLGAGAAGAVLWTEEQALLVGRADGRLERLDPWGRGEALAPLGAGVTALGGAVGQVAFSLEDGTVGGWRQGAGGARWQTATRHRPGPPEPCLEAVSAVQSPAVRQLALSPDGAHVASVGGDGALWLSAEGTDTRTLAEGIRAVAWSPDGAWLGAVDREGQVRVWRLPEGALHSVRGPWPSAADDEGCGAGDDPDPGALLAAAGGPGGLLVAGRGGQARVLPWGSDDAGVALIHPPSALVRAALSADGALAALAGHDGAVRVFDAHTGRMRLSRQDHQQGVLALGFSPDGRWLVSSADDDGTVLLDAHTGARRWLARGSAGTRRALGFSPAGEHLAVASDTGLRRYAVGPPAALDRWDHRGRGRPSALSAGAGRVAVAWTAGPAAVYAPGQRAPVEDLPERALDCVAFGPDGRALLLSGPEGSEVLGGPRLPGRVAYWGQPWAPDGQRLALWSAGVGRVVDLAGQVLAELGDDLLPALVFSPDGSQVLAAGQDHSVRSIDARTGQEWLRLRPPPGARVEGELGLAWRADGRAFSAVSPLGRWLLVQTEGRSWRVDEPSMGLWTAWRGRQVWVSRGSQGVMAWDGPGAPTAQLRGNAGMVRTARFSPDGARLAVGDETGLVRLWQAEGPPLWAWQAHDGAARQLVYSPDGRWLYSAGDDGLLLRLPGGPAELLRLACAWLEAGGRRHPVCPPGAARELEISLSGAER